MIFIDLVNNLALLVALSIVSGFIGQRWERDTRMGATLQGMLFGGAAVIGILHPLDLGPGLIFDGRSIMVSICGLFFGPWPAALAGLMAATCRILIGGMGTITGVLVVLSSVAMGIFFHQRWRRQVHAISVVQLLLFGIAVHVAMLAIMFTLPLDVALTVWKRIGLPVIIAYPLATVLIGKILSDQERQRQYLNALKQGEEKYRTLFEESFDGLFITSPGGRILDINKKGVLMFGYDTKEEILSLDLEKDVYAHPQDRERIISMVNAQGMAEEEILVKKKSGDKILTLCSLTAVRDDGGRVVSYQGIIRDITERKRVEEALRESEERFRTLIELTPDLVYRVDRKGMFIYVNPMFEKVTGYKASELIGQPFTVIIAPECREAVVEHFKKGIRDKRVPVYESEIMRRDGTRVPVEFQAGTLHDKNGKPIGRFGIGRDITERKRLEQTLITSEKKYRNLVDHTLVGVYQTNLEGRILYANQAFAEMFGYDSPQELMSINVISLYKNKEDRTAFIETIRKDKKCLNYDLKLVTKDGKDKDIILSGVLDGDKISGTLVDISDRKQAEKALRAAEKLYRTLADSSQIATYIVQDKKLVFANPHVSRYSGYVQENLIGKDIADFVHPEDRERVRQNAAQMLKGESAVPYEYRIIDRQGQGHWLVETVAPITYHGRRATLGSAMDITEHKHIEKQLQDAKDQLAQSEKLAAIGVLASGAAHEILNPLNILSMRLQMMQMMKYSEDEVRKSFEICKNQIDRIVKIVGGIRTFSYLPEKTPAEKKNLAEMMDDVLRLSASRIKGERVATEVNYDLRIPLLHLDKEAIEQVLFNLVSNALDAMKDREKRILRVVSEKKGNKVLIIISDTGTGVPPEIRSKIFDPFFTTKGPGQGTGLGLSVSYGIIKGHGGRIWAENNKSGGASFFIELPAGESSAP